jgi:hypothetical protein
VSNELPTAYISTGLVQRGQFARLLREVEHTRLPPQAGMMRTPRGTMFRRQLQVAQPYNGPFAVVPGNEADRVCVKEGWVFAGDKATFHFNSEPQIDIAAAGTYYVILDIAVDVESGLFATGAVSPHGNIGNKIVGNTINHDANWAGAFPYAYVVSEADFCNKVAVTSTEFPGLFLLATVTTKDDDGDIIVTGITQRWQGGDIRVPVMRFPYDTDAWHASGNYMKLEHGYVVSWQHHTEMASDIPLSDVLTTAFLDGDGNLITGKTKVYAPWQTEESVHTGTQIVEGPP